MKTLEQESENFKKKTGANGKWVQAEKIKAQIEILELHIEHPTKPGYKRHDVLDRIKSLKVQLKQLEDETKI